MREREKFLNEHDKKREKELRDSSMRGTKDMANAYGFIAGMGGDQLLALDALPSPSGSALN